LFMKDPFTEDYYYHKLSEKRSRSGSDR